MEEEKLELSISPSHKRTDSRNGNLSFIFHSCSALSQKVEATPGLIEGEERLRTYSTPYIFIASVLTEMLDPLGQELLLKKEATQLNYRSQDFWGRYKNHSSLTAFQKG